MRLRPALLQFCLAFALLLAQQGGYWHALTHLAAETSSQERGLPEPKACPLDAAYAKVGSGMAPVPLDIAAICGTDFVSSTLSTPVFAPALGPSARAPPAVL